MSKNITQMDRARAGEITPEMKIIAGKEKVTPEYVRDEVTRGRDEIDRSSRGAEVRGDRRERRAARIFAERAPRPDIPRGLDELLVRLARDLAPIDLLEPGAALVEAPHPGPPHRFEAELGHSRLLSFSAPQNWLAFEMTLPLMLPTSG